MSLLTREVKCAIREWNVKQFKEDLTRQKFPFSEYPKINGSVFKVTIPVGLADIFATYVNSNEGDML